MKLLEVVRIISAVVILVLVIWVVLNPTQNFAPAPRILLFLLASTMIALLVGAEAATQFKLKLPGFLFVTGGASALCFGGAFMLYNVAKPAVQVGLYNLYDEADNPLNLNWDGAFEIPSTLVAVNYYHQRNTLIVVFPEQLPRLELRVRTRPNGPVFKGEISYGTADTQRVTLGKELKREAKND